MTTESQRTSHSGSHAALVGVEVLVLDADTGVHAGITQLLAEASLHVTTATDAARALALIDKQFFAVALVDIDTPEPGAGIATISEIRSLSQPGRPDSASAVTTVQLTSAPTISTSPCAKLIRLMMP